MSSVLDVGGDVFAFGREFERGFGPVAGNLQDRQQRRVGRFENARWRFPDGGQCVVLALAAFDRGLARYALGVDRMVIFGGRIEDVHGDFAIVGVRPLGVEMRVAGFQ